MHKLVQAYVKKLNMLTPTESLCCKPPKQKATPRSRDGSMPKRSPSSSEWLSPGDFLIVLDERGVSFSSKTLATKMQHWVDDPGVRCLRLVVGGPHGHTEALRDQAHLLMRLSDATLPTELAWLLLHENIYRAMTLIRGLPYHHE